MESYTGINEQTGVYSTLEWDDLSLHSSVLEFWQWILKEQHFHRDKSQVSKYLRICEIHRISPSEFTYLYNNLINPLPSHLVNKAGTVVTDVYICRDEELIKELIWCTPDKYWRLVWSREIPPPL